MEPGGRKADHDVSSLDLRSVERLLDDAHARPGEVELPLAVDAGELGRLAADERHAGRAADLRRTFDEVRDLLELDPPGGEVVEQDQRLRAAGDHVVEAMRREIGAARPEGPPPAAEDQFRADTVGRGCEEAAVA